MFLRSERERRKEAVLPAMVAEAAMNQLVGVSIDCPRCTGGIAHPFGNP
jgi:hypothetical protein